MSNRPSHESVVKALTDMIDLAEISMDVLTGNQAGRAEKEIIAAKHVLEELENS